MQTMTTRDPAKAKRDAFFAELAADPEKFRRESDEEIRRKNPQVTQKELDESWEQLRAQFGL